MGAESRTLPEGGARLRRTIWHPPGAPMPLEMQAEEPGGQLALAALFARPLGWLRQGGPTGLDVFRQSAGGGLHAAPCAGAGCTGWCISRSVTSWGPMAPYQSILRVATMMAASTPKSSSEPIMSALSSDTRMP